MDEFRDQTQQRVCVGCRAQLANLADGLEDRPRDEGRHVPIPDDPILARKNACRLGVGLLEWVLAHRRAQRLLEVLEI